MRKPLNQKASSMTDHTKLLYLDNFSLTTCSATVISCEQENNLENSRTAIVLDQTVFYPQGGGQPYDTGKIFNQHAEFLVTDVRFIDGIVKHFGIFTSGMFALDDTVTCTITIERRNLHSRLHSAGHVVDMAVYQTHPEWIPGKGYHFPDGPYVEYAGSLENIDREKLKAELETTCNTIVSENRQTTLLFIPKEEMGSVCRHVPDYLPAHKPTRV